MDLNNYRFIIVGSGFLGSVLAERIANELGEEVAIIEKRCHTGGNCYSENEPETGIHYHKYGTHIFHTSDPEVMKYINKFCTFNNYRHQVLTNHCGRIFQMPINLETINSFYGMNLRPYEVEKFLKKEIGTISGEPKNFEEKAISLIGKPLYEAFIKGYTEKQWHVKASEIPASLLSRLPIRNNYDESYYDTLWQGIPAEGYDNIFAKLLSSKKITTFLNTDYFDIKEAIPQKAILIYTGAIDRFFDYRFGRLQWISLRFEKEIHEVSDYQGTAVMNYADHDVPYTRIHEPMHLHPERKYNSGKSVIFKEFSQMGEALEPFYPINNQRNNDIFHKYLLAAGQLPENIYIGGRLGEYKYHDIDDTIASALNIFEQIKMRYRQL